MQCTFNDNGESMHHSVFEAAFSGSVVERERRRITNGVMGKGKGKRERGGRDSWEDDGSRRGGTSSVARAGGELHRGDPVGLVVYWVASLSRLDLGTVK